MHLQQGLGLNNEANPNPDVSIIGKKCFMLIENLCCITLSNVYLDLGEGKIKMHCTLATCDPGMHPEHGHGDFSQNIACACTFCNNLCRVATAQGKQGIWLLTFSDRENTGNLVNFIFYTGKIVATQGKFCY